MHFALNNKYPIETEAHVKIAVDYFDKNLHKFHPEDRVKIATNINNRIDDLAVDVDRPWVYNYSRAMEKNASFSPDFEQNMKRRMELAKTAKAMLHIDDKKNVPVYDVLSQCLQKYASKQLTPGEAIDLLSEIDKAANFEYHYDKRIKDPFMTVFGCDTHPDFDIVKLAANCPVSARHAKVQMKKKPIMTKMAESFGEKFASEFSADPETLYKSMPAPEQQLISEIIQG